ncbi:thermonuclease family protein [Pleurocapsa sp. PCC 7319]|uniref:thermonuclease family protein n=1 Tax=Pleurocapsa sp. PCC 7319 TaxID=118161 RepID=UPI0021107161|nr:thermonuclease family protein [Pleurocapsa sp. PCC 7319]
MAKSCKVTVDKYGRTVGEIYQENKSINLKMVESGMAVVYHQYLDGCSETKEQYLQRYADLLSTVAAMSKPITDIF